MFVQWLRENKYAAVVLLFIRLYLGYEWLTHGWQKLTGGFNAGGFLNNAVAKPVIDKATNELVYPTFTAFINTFAVPNVKMINFLIPLGEFFSRSWFNPRGFNYRGRFLRTSDELHVHVRGHGKHEPVVRSNRRDLVHGGGQRR